MSKVPFDTLSTEQRENAKPYSVRVRQLKMTGKRMNLLARPALICCLLIAAFAATPNASAVDYPVRPIKLVVPYAAGGPTDVLGRLVADYLGRDLKQTVIVENKPGAQGAIGAIDADRARWSAVIRAQNISLD